MEKILKKLRHFYFPAVFIFIAVSFTGAYYSDSVSTTNNTFTAGTWTVTPTATPTPSSLVINEISSAGSEWIELYHSGGALSLDGYTINDEYSIVHSQSLDGYNIPPSGYLVLYRTVDFSYALNDDQDALELKNSGVSIDRVEYGSVYAPVPSSGESIARIPNGNDTDNDATDFQIRSGINVTPGGPNV